MTDKTTCPKCGAQIAGYKWIALGEGLGPVQKHLFRCGNYLGNMRQPKKCKLRMWKQRAEKAEGESERLREVLRECRRYIEATPVPSDLWASGLCRELDEVLKGPPPTERIIKGSEGE